MGKRAFQPGRPVRENVGVELELAVNELAADQAAVRIVLQSFLLRLFALRPDAAPAIFLCY